MAFGSFFLLHPPRDQALCSALSKSRTTLRSIVADRIRKKSVPIALEAGLRRQRRPEGGGRGARCSIAYCPWPLWLLRVGSSRQPSQCVSSSLCRPLLGEGGGSNKSQGVLLSHQKTARQPTARDYKVWAMKVTTSNQMRLSRDARQDNRRNAHARGEDKVACHLSVRWLSSIGVDRLLGRIARQQKPRHGFRKGGDWVASAINACDHKVVAAT